MLTIKLTTELKKLDKELLQQIECDLHFEAFNYNSFTEMELLSALIDNMPDRIIELK